MTTNLKWLAGSIQKHQLQFISPKSKHPVLTKKRWVEGRSPVTTQNCIKIENFLISSWMKVIKSAVLCFIHLCIFFHFFHSQNTLHSWSTKEEILGPQPSDCLLLYRRRTNVQDTHNTNRTSERTRFRRDDKGKLNEVWMWLKM